MPDFGTETLQFAGSGTATVAALGDAIEAPYNADIVDVLVTSATAPTGDLVVDVKINGTSVFAAALGTVATIAEAQTGGSGGMASGDTTFKYAPIGGENNLQNNQVIVIGSEKMLVTGVTGSSLVNIDGVTPVFIVTVTRAYDGTSAASHAAGVNVTPAKPFIPSGALASGSVDAPFTAVVAQEIHKGDIISANITQIGSTGNEGSNVRVEVAVATR